MLICTHMHSRYYKTKCHSPERIQCACMDTFTRKHIQQKVLPKSKQKSFIGYNDGSHSMEYYNAKTKTIFTSQNFHFLSPAHSNPPEYLIIQPDQVVRGVNGFAGWFCTHNRFCRNLYLKCLIRFKDILQVYRYFKCLDSVNFKCK